MNRRGFFGRVVGAVAGAVIAPKVAEAVPSDVVDLSRDYPYRMVSFPVTFASTCSLDVAQAYEVATWSTAAGTVVSPIFTEE